MVNETRQSKIMDVVSMDQREDQSISIGDIEKELPKEQADKIVILKARLVQIEASNHNLKMKSQKLLEKVQELRAELKEVRNKVIVCQDCEKKAKEEVYQRREHHYSQKMHYRGGRYGDWRGRSQRSYNGRGRERGRGWSNYYNNFYKKY